MAHSGFVGAFDRSERGDGRLTQRLAALVLFVLLMCLVLWMVTGLKTVPDVTGMTKSEAANVLKFADLALGDATRRSSETQAAGTVLEQSLKAGTRVLAGTRVDVVVADAGKVTVETSGDEGEQKTATGIGVPAWNGNPPREETIVDYDSAAMPSGVQVPSVMGMSRSSALSALSAAGLRGSVSSGHSTTNVPPGTVYAQKPSAGSYQPAGTTIVIYLSEGAPSQGYYYSRAPYE